MVNYPALSFRKFLKLISMAHELKLYFEAGFQEYSKPAGMRSSFPGGGLLRNERFREGQKTHRATLLARL